MSLPTVPVLFIARDQTGDPLPGARVEAKLNRVEILDGFVVPEIVTAIADVNGECTLQLFPNVLGSAGSAYRVQAWDSSNKLFLQGYAVVPNAPCELHDILVATAAPSLDMAVSAAARAAASAIEAADAATRAVAAAGGGLPGEIDPSGAFLVTNRFSEIATNPAAQSTAQTNLGLGVSDPLAYYILAKA